MNKNSLFPNIDCVPPEPWAVERLQRWCELWALDRALAENAPAFEDGRGPRDETVCVLPRDLQKLEPGQVALLPPLGTDDPPLHVLVLASPDGRSFDCIPFSRFPEPATPGELLSGLEPDALRVLCLWNARRQPRAHMPLGWPIAALSPQLTECLQDALEQVRRRGCLPCERTREGGPPLTHPDDPRRAYLHAERLRVNRHATPATTRVCYPTPEPRLGLAAEPPPDWDRKA